MKKYCLLLLFVPMLCMGQKDKVAVWKQLDGQAEKYTNIAMKIWDYAEIGYKEVKSSALLSATLEEAGFTVDRGVAGMPTAFVASYGSGKPVIGILGEFDALPGLAQQAVPEQKTVEGRDSGHGCGHHLFGTASGAAAIAVKNWMKKNRIAGTLRFYGTPAEEGGSGKVYMVRAGLFEDVDAIFHWHPGSGNSASLRPTLANKTGKFRFYGKAAHAAGAPEKGRSALDAVEAMNVMANMMREHVTEKSRIHYVITRGGEAPNVVPAFAEVYYYIRHPNRTEVKAMWNRLLRIADGAAMGTDTKVEVEVTGGVYELLLNEALGRAVHKNLSAVGGYQMNSEESAFGERIHETLMSPRSLATTDFVAEFKTTFSGSTGSTDVGDVSWMAPTAGLSTATWVPGTPAHSWQAVAAGGTSIGAKGMMIAAKALAGAMIDTFTDSALLAQAQQEFDQKRGKGFSYEPMVGNRKPALNYRD